MNILITGANGQLGNEMRLMSRNSKDHYIFTDVAELDITDSQAVNTLVAKENVEVIVNCAAYTNVDRAEDDEALAERLNSDAVRILAHAMQERGGWLIHVSTDYVFGGNAYNTPINEEARVNPTGAYGRTKLHGEEAILASGVKYIMLRTAWLYSEFGKNFVKTMLDLTATKPELKVVFDQVGTPTYAGDLAKVIFDRIEQRQLEGNEGIYHFSNEGVCSWYDFTQEIARQADHANCRILPCHSNEFPSKVVRPSFSVLDKTKIKKTFGITVPYWTDSLTRCMKNLTASDSHLFIRNQES